MNEQQIFDTEQTFADLGLRDSVVRGLDKEGFNHPTHIQAQLIPKILEGRDVMGQARTGTGKTAAFALPILHGADKNTPIQALILAPTRELAQQVHSVFKQLGKDTPIRALAIYGGESIRKQTSDLHKKPQVIVGTPGRVMDMHNRGLLPYDNIHTLVLDEVDRMLDIGFRDDIRKILSDMPNKPQTIFVSATISPEIESLARKFMTDPLKVETTSGSLTVAQVDQSYITVEPWDKKRLLLHLLTHEEPDVTLVFCRMKVTVDQVARYLRKKEIDVHAIHGDMPQRKRNAIIHKLRHGSLSVVVASDVASRGLDISNISHVVNFDLPEDPEIYIHRIGRTARAGASGVAWSFVTPDEGKLLTQIEILANTEIPEKDYPDFEPGEPPAKVREEREAEEARRAKQDESKTNRYKAKSVEDAVDEDEIDPVKFPGGIAPKKAPKRRMGGKVSTRRRR